VGKTADFGIFGSFLDPMEEKRGSRFEWTGDS
jgi:hypothetical protein